MRRAWMAPQWLACPEIPQYSIGWRMGYGEDYICRLMDWLQGLSPAEQAEYQRLFPAPVFWDGLEETTQSDSPLYYEHGNYLLRLWRPSGRPAYDRPALERDFAEGKELKFLPFWGNTPPRDGRVNQCCLSQWWLADFSLDAQRYCCMEQYMMAEKARLFDDQEALEEILLTHEPGKIKALGRQVKDFDAAVWDRCKYTIVLTGSFQKFLQNPALKDFLLRTGDKILVEASPYDRIWGIGMDASNEAVQDPMLWQGQNLLGFALMEVRAELRRVCANEGQIDWSLGRRS